MRSKSVAYFAAAVAAFLLGSGLVLAQPSQPAAQKYPGGYLKYTYRTEAGVVNLVETTTTEIVPLPDGQYEMTTTTRGVAGREQIRLGLFGISLQWLGLYVGENAGTRIDLSPLNALATQVLEPQKKYLLPDGGLFETGDRVTVAGLSGIEGTYTQANAPGVVVTVVLADDLELRVLLPFPLRTEIRYVQGGNGSDAEDASGSGARFSGRIELIEYKRTQ